MSLAEERDALEESVTGPELETIVGEEQANRELLRLRGLREQAVDAMVVATGHVEQVARWLEDRLGVKVTLVVRAAGVKDDGSLERDAEVDGGIGARMRQVEERLELYHRARLDQDPKALTISLPMGALVSRAGSWDWEVTDEEALIAWGDEHVPDIVRRKPAPDAEIDRNALKSELVKRDGRKIVARGVDPNTGEKPPGLEVRETERTFRADTGDV